MGVEEHFLDLGGGEIGLYGYRLDEFGSTVGSRGEVTCTMIARKEAVPPLDGTLATSIMRASDAEQVAAAWAAWLATLRAQLVKYLRREATWAPLLHEIGNSPSRGAPIRRLVVGITGILAFAAENSEVVADCVEDFIGQLEQDWMAESGSRWELNYFVLYKQSEAIFERIAIRHLLANSDMGLTASFAERRELHEYVRQQLTSWALLGGRKYGELDQFEFVEKMMPLSSEPTLERRVMAALDWFRQMDVDGSKSVTVGEMLSFILSAEELLQAVVCKRLFVGTLACGTSAMQLTVSDPEVDGEVSLVSCPVGNKTPLRQGVFREGERVRPEDLERWRQMLEEALSGEVVETPAPEEAHRGRLNLTARSLSLHPGRLLHAAAQGVSGSGSSRAPTSPPGGRGRVAASPSSAPFGVPGGVRSVGLQLGSEDPLNQAQTQAWPSGLRGILVGISSMFYAAQACGIQEQLVAKRVAVAAMERVLLEELRATFPSPETARSEYLEKVKAHQRKVANVAMAQAMLSHVLHEDAFVYFRRNWRMPDGSNFVATWSLGVFLSSVRHSPLNEPQMALARAASRIEGAFRSRKSTANVEFSSDEEDEEPESHGGRYWRRLSVAFSVAASGVRRRSSGPEEHE